MILETVRLKSTSAVSALVLTTLVTGCGSASSVFAPTLVAQGELTLRYDDGVEVYAGKKRLTDAPGFSGLSKYVRCVPVAYEHAQAAESDGSAAIGTGFAGAIIGVGALGGLAGLAFLEDDKPLAFGLFGTGVAVGLLGMTMALISRGLKITANGHAVDAVNYYNDEVGFYGGSCNQPAAPVVVDRPGPVKGPTVEGSVAVPADGKVGPAAPVPTEAVPAEAVPTGTVPTATVPTATVPTATVPTATVPTEIVPTEPVPTEPVPSAPDAPLTPSPDEPTPP